MVVQFLIVLLNLSRGHGVPEDDIRSNFPDHAEHVSTYYD